MSEGTAIERAKDATAEFWEKFFNQKDMEAFDRFAHATYQQNGMPSADGAYLKQWVQGMNDLSVTVERVVGAEMGAKLDDGDPLKIVTTCIYWTATGERDNKPFKTAGMNILYFDAESNRVMQNWHCSAAD
jgi:hypothetical protein